eukprot:TRINITY_DN1711_c1_g1_i3.p1 TRINITY_DN1711_c1_g1~~TRINITY_DN1711_c1_g1_i3.p1  ORF type:complete len:189 (+),score=19.15 TRINITY_DN1711_c1_g1_i3:230-796(+)
MTFIGHVGPGLFLSAWGLFIGCEAFQCRSLTKARVGRIKFYGSWAFGLIAAFAEALGSFGDSIIPNLHHFSTHGMAMIDGLLHLGRCPQLGFELECMSFTGAGSIISIYSRSKHSGSITGKTMGHLPVFLYYIPSRPGHRHQIVSTWQPACSFVGPCFNGAWQLIAARRSSHELLAAALAVMFGTCTP